MNNQRSSLYIRNGLLFHCTLALLCGALVLAGMPTIAHAQTKGHEPDTRQPTSLAQRVFLPIVMQNYEPTLPRLIAPEDGAVLDTLIPVFVFEADTLPPDTGGVLDFGTDPDPNRPTNWWASFGFQSGQRWEMRAWFNLQPSTTYYWRVGLVYDYNYTVPPRWSSQFSFTTGPAGGPTPSAPSLVSPSNGSVVAANNVVLEWAPTAQAVEYQIYVHDLVRDWWYGYSTSSTQVNISGSGIIQPGNDYEWYVEARTDYAWGSQSATWRFDVAPSESSMHETSRPGSYVVRGLDGKQRTTHQMR